MTYKINRWGIYPPPGWNMVETKRGRLREINIQNKTKTRIQMSLSQDVMAEQERTSDPAATGEVGGLASDPHMVDETMKLTHIYHELIDKEEELAREKNTLSLSKKSISLKKTTKQAKPRSTPRGKGEI